MMSKGSVTKVRKPFSSALGRIGRSNQWCSRKIAKVSRPLPRRITQYVLFHPWIIIHDRVLVVPGKIFREGFQSCRSNICDYGLEWQDVSWLKCRHTIRCSERNGSYPRFQLWKNIQLSSTLRSTRHYFLLAVESLENMTNHLAPPIWAYIPTSTDIEDTTTQ